MKHDYIRRVFTDLEKLKIDGIFFSGVDGEGEYKKWFFNGKLQFHCFFKNNKTEGEYKTWYDNGILALHYFYKEGIKNGKYKLWDMNGKLKDHYLYKDGNIIKDYLK